MEVTKVTVKEIANKLDLEIINLSEEDSEPKKVYCCDLLSIVMSKAPKEAAWVTVMANANTVAVAVLSEISCVILSEDVKLDEETLKKAQEQGVNILATDMPTFKVAKKIDKLIKQ